MLAVVKKTSRKPRTKIVKVLKVSKGRPGKRATKPQRRQAVTGRATAVGAIRYSNMLASRAGASAAASALALAISLPQEHPNFRLPTVDGPRTSALTLRDQFTVSSPATAVPNWNTGDLLFAVFGHPSRLAMQSYSGASSAVYKGLFNLGTSIGNTWEPNITLSGSTTAEQGQGSQVWPLVGTNSSGGGAHGTTQPIALSAGVPYLWFSSTDTLTITSSALVTWTGQLFFSLKRWTNRDATPTDSATPVTLTITTATSTFVTVTPATFSGSLGQGHYALVLESALFTTGSNNGAFLTVQNTISAASTGWGIVHMGDLDPVGGDVLIGNDTRTNGFSFLATNTTSLLNRQGTVLAARMKDVEFCNQTPATIARVAEKYTGDAEKGVYTYLEFSSTREKFRNATPNGYPAYPLDDDDFYHFIQISCPNVATTANTFTCAYDTTLEFKTDSARYPKGVSRFQFDKLIEARILCNSTPDWFYENPLHWRDIVTRIKSGARAAYGAVRSYGPTAMAMGARAFPQYSPALMAARTLMQRM
jgi:hypothetical protein